MVAKLRRYFLTEFLNEWQPIFAGKHHILTASFERIEYRRPVTLLRISSEPPLDF
ncbi:hypothetical protein DPMN_131261 [Dreissena polymorpha]|uniref:Uncharacterized protein n=1 Tax=Dreissena polymorpha TaxID=45954 RepID=A0A9D4JZ67_DREPO|nr:hypothetical protein DPMN_131261 [Dreissena polymorpha]